MMICIGIVSYLPDSDIRIKREEKLRNLIKNCNNIFCLPIIIIAQNWKNFSIDGCDIHRFDSPLGIVGARNKLREIFLESEYDYLIMLDDDCEIFGDREVGTKYINQIENHPNMWGQWSGTLLKLFAISKNIFKEVDFGSGSVENGDYFEDILFVNTLEKKFSNKKFNFMISGLRQDSNNFNDPDSTWFYGQFNKHDIGDRTRSLLRKVY